MPPQADISVILTLVTIVNHACLPDHRVTLVKFLLSSVAFTKVSAGVYTCKMFT